MKIQGNLISLKALETFEVAARHLHLGHAAKELNITQSAVSHQIKKLEEAIGVSLFERVGRGLRLTISGDRLSRTTRQAFQTLEAGTRELNPEQPEGKLTVAAPAGYLSLFLLPRLNRFINRYRNLSIEFLRLPPGQTKTDVPADITISINRTHYSNRRVVELFELSVYPVCSASQLPLQGKVSLESMRERTLVHDDDGTLFSKWFAEVGLEQPENQQNIYVQNARDALELVRSGVGFTLGDNLLEKAQLIDRSFIAPFERRVRSGQKYFLSTRNEGSITYIEKAFSDWILQETSLP